MNSRYLKQNRTPDPLFKFSSTCLASISGNGPLILSIPWAKSLKLSLTPLYSWRPTNNQPAKLIDSLFKTCPESDHFLTPPPPPLQLFSNRLSNGSLWNINQTMLPSSKFFSDFLPLSEWKTKGITMAYKAIKKVCKPPSCTPLWLLFLLTHSTPATLASCFSSHMLNFLLPQDLCICFSLYLRWPSPTSGSHMPCSSMSLFSLITFVKQHLCKYTGGDVRSFFYFLYLALFFSVAPNRSEYIYLFVILFCFFLSPVREYIPWRPFFVIAVVYCFISSS